MQPTTKTALLVGGVILSVFIVPAIIILLRDFWNLIILVCCVCYSLYLVCYHGYQDLLPYIRRHQIEEERIFDSFNGDPEKIRFYRAFRKHFDGDLNLKELEEWLIKHPRKH